MIIANSKLRATLAIYHLISTARTWNNCYFSADLKPQYSSDYSYTIKNSLPFSFTKIDFIVFNRFSTCNHMLKGIPASGTVLRNRTFQPQYPPKTKRKRKKYEESKGGGHTLAMRSPPKETPTLQWRAISAIRKSDLENEVLFGNQVVSKNWLQRAFKISTIIFNNSFASFHDSSLMRIWIIVKRWFPGNPRNDKLKSGHHPFGT